MRTIEGFLFPATYEFFPQTTSRSSSSDQLDAFCENWEKVDLGYARSKNLTPYDVLIIASMVEKETLSPDERQLVSAVIYNRLKAGMTLGIDATTALRARHSRRPSRSVSRSSRAHAVQHAKHRRPAADADREPGPGVAAGGGAPGEGQLPLLRPQARQEAPLLHREHQAFQNYANAHGYG